MKMQPRHRLLFRWFLLCVGLFALMAAGAWVSYLHLMDSTTRRLERVVLETSRVMAAVLEERARLAGDAGGVTPEALGDLLKRVLIRHSGYSVRPTEWKLIQGTHPEGAVLFHYVPPTSREALPAAPSTLSPPEEPQPASSRLSAFAEIPGTDRGLLAYFPTATLRAGYRVRIELVLAALLVMVFAAGWAGYRMSLRRITAQTQNSGWFGRSLSLAGFSGDDPARVELTDPLGLLHLVADHLPAPIAYVDRDLVYKFVNRTLCEWYNLPATHIVGKRAEDLLPQVTIEKVRPHWDTALSGRIAQFETAILYPDGYTRPVVINYVPQILVDGSIPGFFVLSVDITLLKNAESRAAETSRLLQSVMDTVPHAIFVKDEEGRYTMVNRAFCEFHGLAPQDILGRTIHDFGDQTRLEKNALITLDEALWRTGTPAENPELTLTNHKGGEEIHNVFKLPLRNEQGELVGLVGLSEDITSRVRAERDLRKSEERTRAILSALPDMMFVVNREGLIEDFHTQDLQALFMPPEHFLGKPVHAVLPSPVGESIWRLLQEAMTQGSLKTLEYALPLPSGVCEYEARMVALNDSKAITLVRDITQQKQAGRALRDSEQRLTQILDAIPAALFLKDVQGRYRYVNRKFTELWGFTLAEVEGKTSDVLFPDQQWEAFIDLDEQVRMTGRIIEQELRVSTLDGAVRDMINTKFPLYDSENRLRGIGVIITDISKLRLTETQLRQAQKMEAIGQLAGGIAHDFNNLLQVILGYTLLLRARTDLPKESMDPLSAIQTASSRAAELTQQLLGYSRQQTLRRRVVDLNDLIAQQMRMVQRVIGESIELTFRPQARKAIVNVDSGAIEQVLLNLCLNARDAMPKGGSLILKTGTLLADARFCNANSWARSGEYVTITVQDTGVGIPKEHLERIFEPFFTTKEIGKGSGLGLSMTYGLLQQHDGYITAHSEHGVGATFVVYLPQSKEIPLVGLEAPVAPKPQGRGTLLVAEDDPRVLMLVQTILKQAGYEVLSVSNGEEAVSLLQRSGHSIDLALLDVVMPKLGGREVFKHIQTHHPGLPVVFSTGYSADMLDAEFLKQHEVTIIHKPYDPASLLQVVQKSIASRTTGSGPKPD